MRVMIDGRRTGAAHMALDERLAHEGKPVLRLFRWHPTACSLGWKQPRPSWLDARRLDGTGIEVVERPTGGGLAYHGSDLSCAVVIPHDRGRSIHALLSAVCEAVTELCRSFGVQAAPELHGPSRRRVAVCLAEPSPYAVICGGRKVAGFAARRFRESWLIHGSLLVRPIPSALRRLIPPAVALQLERRALSLSEAAGRPLAEDDVATRWSERWPFAVDAAAQRRAQEESLSVWEASGLRETPQQGVAVGS